MNKQTLRSHIAQNSKILLVDDEETSLHMMRMIFRNAGFLNIEEALDGEEARAKIIRWQPDLVLLDMYMPKIDGLEVCRWAQRQPASSQTIFIMQTVADDTNAKVAAFEVGVTDYVTKPLSPVEVTARAFAHLERQYFRGQVESDYSRIQKDLKEATTLQSILLPQDRTIEAIRTGLGIDIAHYYKPASELAGDYLSVRQLSDNRIALICGDVAGHGITAALYTFSIHTLLTNELLENNTPGEALLLLGEELKTLMTDGRFATIFLGIIDADARQLQYAAAASPSPVLMRQSEPSLLDTSGYLLGINHAGAYTTHTVPFHPGDALFLYSDALIETENTQGDCISEEQIVARLCENAAADSIHTLESFVNAYDADYVVNHSDDLTMLMCKW